MDGIQQLAAASCLLMASNQTAAAEETLEPEWGEEFAFVVGGTGQHLRMLLSHKRMELQIGDMPLGAAEIAIDDVIADAGTAEAALRAGLEAAAAAAVARERRADAPATALARTSAQEPGEASSSAAATPQLAPSLSRGDAGYASAGSSPSGSLDISWATPAASLMLPDDEASPAPGARSFNPQPRGLGADMDAAAALHAGGTAAADCGAAHQAPTGGGWLSEDGVWVQVPSVGAITLAGLVADATEPRERCGEPARSALLVACRRPRCRFTPQL
jgi:hypothetical protein